RDPIFIATALKQNLQSIVSRNFEATKPPLLSVTQAHTGPAYNVVPDSALFTETTYYRNDAVNDLMPERFRRLCAGFAQSYEVDVAVGLREVFEVLVNDADCSKAYLEAAAEIVGPENATEHDELITGSEDFADMLRAIPGAYCTLGHKGN